MFLVEIPEKDVTMMRFQRLCCNKIRGVPAQDDRSFLHGIPVGVRHLYGKGAIVYKMRHIINTGIFMYG